MSLVVPPFGVGQFVRLFLAFGSRFGRLFGLVALTCMLAAPAAAGDVYFPGSLWSSSGTLSPVEKGNFLSFTHVEQGVAWKGLEVFGQSTLSADTKNFDWNRRFLNGVGARFTQQLGSHGMVRASYSYVRERRWNLERTYEGPVFAVEAWIGWNNAPRPQK